MKLNTRTKLAASATALATGMSMLALLPATAADKVDGKTSETAAASCFEIKQNDPSSKSGSYWLYTPSMSAPAQFYCDQETDGGGWVLIGRGRDGWTEEYAGKGNASELASNPDGTDAFTPVQLNSSTIDALLDGQSPSNLADGIRVKRALNSNGTSWQEARLGRKDASRWSWALSATSEWQNLKFTDNGGRTYSYSSTNDNIANFDNSTRQMKYLGRAEQDYKIGWSYGGSITGANNASTYLWSKGGGNALPFTQVFLRPKLITANLNYGEVADSGAAGSTRQALPNSYSAKMVWRTSEKTATGKTGEMNSYVQAITQVGNTVFVGGDYAYVQSASGEQVQQPYLTGYDVNTGELVRTFVPKFNNQIKSLEALPNGWLAVGGEFTQVNGQNVAGLVLLDPVTGEIKNDWNWTLENRVSGSAVSVKSMDVQGDYLYLGGSFTHLKGSANNNFTYARNMARYNTKTGAIDTKFTPVFNGTVNGVSASEDGQTAYAAGYFGTVNNQTAKRLAALNTSDGSRKANWDWKFSFADARPIGGFQFDVQDAGSTVFTGGAEHIIAQYDSTTFARRTSAITRGGGDFQDLHKSGDVIYGACHCGDWTYEGAETYDDAWIKATDVQQIRLVAAFDSKTGRVIPEFNPQIRGASGNGIWESFVDSTGTLWVGGDINSSVGANGAQKTVGFARFTARDVTAPAAPTGLKVTSANGQDTLTWNAVGGAKYQVLRNNKVIATTDSPTYVATHVDNARYFVRSVDTADNYSATTPVALAEVMPDTEKPVLYAIDNKVLAVNEAFSGADANVTNDEAVTFSAEGLPNGLTIDANTGWISGTPTESGVFNVVIRATDLAGNVSDPLNWTVEVTGNAQPVTPVEPVQPVNPGDTEKPVLYAIDNKVLKVNEAFKGADANVTNGEEVTFSAVGLPKGLVIDAKTGWITGTPTESGVFNVTVTATDLAGNVSDPLAWRVEVTGNAQPAVPADTEKPVLYSIDNKVLPVNEVFKGADANVTNGEEVTFSAEGLPQGLTISPQNGWITGKPTETGVFNVTIKATDLAGNVSDPINWRVEVTGNALAQAAAVSQESVLSYGEKWSYKSAAWHTTSGWNKLSGYGLGWQTTNASIGWGDAPVTTNLNYGSDAPTALYLRKEISLSNVGSIQKLTLKTYADDGFVVYVNGQEVTRSNMAGGKVSYNTNALSAKNTTESREQVVTFDVPQMLLREGNNSIAVSVHSAGKTSANVSFDMSAEVTR